MTEIFFILTVVYAAYTIHHITKKSPNEKAVNTNKQAIDKKTTSSSHTKSITKINNTPKIELRTVILKNPHTGEQAKVAHNYRMTKRWIKEALVEEKLLDKIYKNNELNEQSKPLIADALAQLKAMDKYKV